MTSIRLAVTGVLLTIITCPLFVAAQAQVEVSVPAVLPWKVVTRVEPVYPPEAQRLGLEADVTLKLTVNVAGDVTNTEMIDGGIPKIHRDDENAAERLEFVATHPRAFGEAAGAAARQWKFEPSSAEWSLVCSFKFRRKPAGEGSQLSIKAPRKLVDVKPLYPDAARAAKSKGVVLLEVTIAPDGSVSSARVMRSIPVFDQAAIDAVSQWKFEATLLNGVPVEVETLVMVNFVPPSQSP